MCTCPNFQVLANIIQCQSFCSGVVEEFPTRAKARITRRLPKNVYGEYGLKIGVRVEASRVHK